MATRKLVDLTVEEYLEFEIASETKHEFWRGQIFAMSGASYAHNIISGNLFALIHAHLKGSPCRVFMNDMKLHVAKSEAFYYPDIMVSCAHAEITTQYVTDPILLVEVLSPSTRQIDKREKLLSYRQIPNLQEYMIIHQDRKLIELYRRETDQSWTIMPARGNDLVSLESCPEDKKLVFNVEALYDGLDLPMIIQEEEQSYEPA